MDTSFYYNSVNFIYHCTEVFCFATFLTRTSLVRLAAEKPPHSFGCAAFWGVNFPVSSGFIHGGCPGPILVLNFPWGLYLVRFYTLLRLWGSLQSLLGWVRHRAELAPCLCCSPGAPRGSPSLAALLVTPCSLELQYSPSHPHSSCHLLFLPTSLAFTFYF